MSEMDICVRESCEIYRRLFHTPSETAERLYYYPSWAGLFVCRPDFYIRRHSFETLLLLATEQGQGRLLYRGKEYLLDRHHMALINCLEPHTYFPVSQEPWAFRFLHFAGNQSQSLYEHIYALAGTCLFRREEGIYQEMVKCIDWCDGEGGKQETQLSQCISNLLYDILFQVQQEEKDQIAAVCRYVAQHYDQPLTTEYLARIACFSRCYFSIAFKKYTGMTPHEYLICHRLDRAKELLCQGNRTVSSIGESVGFGDVGTFIRVFRRKEKITPFQYQKMHFSTLREEEKKRNSNIYVK